MAKIIIITGCAGLFAFSLFVIFGVSFQGDAIAVLSTGRRRGNGTNWDKFTPKT